jgi:hypothetical protein
MNNSLLIAGSRNPVLVDYAEHCLKREGAATAVVSARRYDQPG